MLGTTRFWLAGDWQFRPNRVDGGGLVGTATLIIGNFD